MMLPIGRTSFVAASCVTAAVTIAAAQTRPPSGDTQQPNDQSSVTIRGCVQVSPWDKDDFILRNAILGKTGSAAPSANTQPQKTTAAPSASTTGKATPPVTAGVSYRLRGQDDELKKHVNHEIELIGVLDILGAPAEPEPTSKDAGRTKSETGAPTTGSSGTSTGATTATGSTLGAASSSASGSGTGIVSGTGAAQGGSVGRRTSLDPTDALPSVQVRSVRMLAATCPTK